MFTKTEWILISRIHQKPADLDPHCFQKRVKNLEKVVYTVHLLNEYGMYCFCRLVFHPYIWLHRKGKWKL